ncbi:MAG: hypothetical protein K2H43_05265, partial [Clostridia bacterium]|nr:hypothetical protein [Clostridia bacterium]
TYGRLNFGSYLFSAIVFACPGFSFAQTIETVRARISGENISRTQLTESVLHCFSTSSAAVLFALLLPYYKDRANNWNHLFLILTLLFSLALIPHAAVRKAFEKTPAADFTAELTCALLLFPNGLCSFILSCDVSSTTIRVCAALSYAFGAGLFAAAVLQIVFAIRSKRKENPQPLRALFFSLPMYITVGIILAVSYWGTPSDSASNGILMISILAIYAAADTLPRLFRKRGAKRV